MSGRHLSVPSICVLATLLTVAPGAMAATIDIINCAPVDKKFCAYNDSDISAEMVGGGGGGLVHASKHRLAPGERHSFTCSGNTCDFRMMVDPDDGCTESGGYFNNRDGGTTWVYGSLNFHGTHWGRQLIMPDSTLFKVASDRDGDFTCPQALEAAAGRSTNHGRSYLEDVWAVTTGVAVYDDDWLSLDGEAGRLWADEAGVEGDPISDAPLFLAPSASTAFRLRRADGAPTTCFRQGDIVTLHHESGRALTVGAPGGDGWLELGAAAADADGEFELFLPDRMPAVDEGVDDFDACLDYAEDFGLRSLTHDAFVQTVGGDRLAAAVPVLPGAEGAFPSVSGVRLRPAIRAAEVIDGRGFSTARSWYRLRLTTSTAQWSGTDDGLRARLHLRDGSKTDFVDISAQGDRLDLGTTHEADIVVQGGVAPEEIVALQLQATDSDGWRAQRIQLVDGTGERFIDFHNDTGHLLDADGGDEPRDGSSRNMYFDLDGQHVRPYTLLFDTATRENAQSAGGAVSARLILSNGARTRWTQLREGVDDAGGGGQVVLWPPVSLWGPTTEVIALSLRNRHADGWRPDLLRLADGHFHTGLMAALLDDVVLDATLDDLWLDDECDRDPSDGCADVANLTVAGDWVRGFTVTSWTGDGNEASDAPIEARFVLDDGSATSWIRLDTPADDFESGWNVFPMLVPLGQIGGAGLDRFEIRNLGTDGWRMTTLEVMADDTRVVATWDGIWLDAECDADPSNGCVDLMSFDTF